MPKNRTKPRDIDNPGAKSERDQVKTPRTFRGSEFSDFPRLVVQMSAARPRPQRPMRAPEERPQPTEQSGAPEGFARPLRGMGVGAYEGLREQMSPQIQDYRTSLHDAYADNVLSEQERKSLRGQRRDLRMGARDYKRDNPLQMGLGARVKEVAQSDRHGGLAAAKTPGMGGMPRPSMERLRQLQELWRAGHISPDQLLAALGFTGKLPGKSSVGVGGAGVAGQGAGRGGSYNG